MASSLTVLDVFSAHIANPQTRERHVVECGDEQWTYDDLDVVSTGLALELEARYGARPTVAIIAENLPYTLALHLAVWKLSGIVAPIDYHTPEALLQHMLKKISPTCVVIPSTEKGTQQVALDAALPLFTFTPQDTTITALCQRFMEVSDLPTDQYPAPDPTSISIYLFTSSASDLTNIKCVALTHQTILAHSRSLLEWDQKTFPDASFQNLRVLGWSPFSHLLSVTDITCHVYLTGGCYIFGLTPSSYVVRGANENAPRDITASLLEAIERYRPDSFAGVPWMFEGIMKTVISEVHSTRREEMISALRRFKLFMCGGAPTSVECIRWAREQRIPLVLAIGMTELGGAIFHRVAEEIDNGWSIAESLISDAQFTLIDADGNSNSSEGELFISSKLIARGYVDHESSAFTVTPDGLITFKTGDRYAQNAGRLKWLGRNDDFIILVSGEMVDPRVLETSLNAHSEISRSAVVGNHFLRGSAQFLCALVELRSGVPPDHSSTNLVISRAIRAVNRALPPQLRLNWSRVLILDAGEAIPINKKGQIWRKKLEALYGNRVARLILAPSDATNGSPTPSSESQTSELPIRHIVLDIVSNALRLSSETLDLNAESTFAELGMDSAAALVIVSKLNERLRIDLPRNACHTHVDLNSLTMAISQRLRQDEPEPTVHLGHALRKQGADSSEDVVIVGQAVRLPGDLNTPESFWEALVDMREDLLGPVPQDRWDHASFLRKSGGPSESGDIHFERAGFVDVAHFDNAFFGISSAEAFCVVPGVRLVLETAFQALENANIPSSQLKGTDTGVFVAGGIDYGYGHLLFAEAGFGSYTRFHGTGSALSTACGRLSYILDVHGPSISIDTACSGGMVAFAQAVEYLRAGRAETAIVSAANTHTWPGDFAFLSAQKMCSPNSRCATFASDADGYVPAEGAVSLILKTRRAAIRDGNTILAVIKATDIKHNGKSQGLVAPSAAGQEALQRSLLARASLTPSDIDLVETHGTGTSLGDLIEIEGINAVFKSSHTADRPLILGAAKACIGHTEVSAGLVGIVKALKQLSTGQAPGLSSIAGGGLNPEIDTTLVPLSIPSNLVGIPKREKIPYRALVVAYGFAGTLAGTILEAPSPAEQKNIAGEPAWMIFALSAKSREALHDYLRAYLDFCMNAPAADFRSICYTSCVGRELYRYRFACVVKDLDGLVQRLKDRLTQVSSLSPYLPNPRVILAFPGQGSQFYGMASALGGRFSEFGAILTNCANMASSVADFDVLSLLLGQNEPTGEIDQSAVAQICIFVYQCSVCRFLRKLRIDPDAVIGNSLGEISAAVEAGALTYELGLQFVVARARILSPKPDRPAGMAAVATSEVTILQCLHDLQIATRVGIAVFSSPDNHVVSGDLDALHVLVSHVKKMGIKAKLLNVDQGFHSHCIDSVLPELEAWIETQKRHFRSLELPIFSTVSGKQVQQHQYLKPGHWINHARNPVQFQQAAAQIKERKVFNTACILDIGPTPTAWAALQSNNMSENMLISSSTREGKDQELAFLAAMASLVEYGINIDFVELFGTGIPKTDLPTYPFQRRRHYPTIVPSRSMSSSPQVPRSSPLVVDEDLFAMLNDHRIQGEIVLPGAAMVDAFARSKQRHSLDIRFHRPLAMQSPGQVCNIEIDAAGTFTMRDDDKGDRLCSGNIAATANGPQSVLHISSSGPATTIFEGDDVYHPFVNVQFGPLFRNIVSIRSWNTHADGLVEVIPSSNPENDRIRALDACIHMFGACRLIPEDRRTGEPGAFLPMALEGYSIYVDALPSSFICRYRLPISLERNYHVASTSFEIISHSGELLASCSKYSVAWVDMGAPQSLPKSVGLSFQQTWIPKELGTKASKATSKITFFGRRCSATDRIPSAELPVAFDDGAQDGTQPVWYSKSSRNCSSSSDTEENSTVVLDVTGADDFPDSLSFSTFWQTTLRALKTLGRNRTRTFNLVITSTAMGSGSIPVLGPMVQGMLRVFRREVGLENVCGIEFPSEVSADFVAEIVRAEVAAIRDSIIKDNMISYRYSRLPGQSKVQLQRFVPELHPVVAGNVPARLSGVSVVVGMGSIGFALGSHLIAAGASVVVFIGRRPAADEKVAEQLASASDRFAYVQADASDMKTLRSALQHITTTHGDIRSILHTAATVSDATIDSVTPEAFDSVLRPKVFGAYNLHLLAAEMTLKLESFVLFSSISVPLGNPGQVAYVAANSFLDSLAACRRSMGLPGVSLQLGPWESELVDHLPAHAPGNALMRTVSHKEGLPLIIRALSSQVPVQVIAAFDVDVLSRTHVLATDTLFAGIAATAGAPKPRRDAPSSASIAESVVSILRGVLELTESQSLELNDSLTASGIDSISFGQIRAKVQKQLGIEVPLIYLSDAFSLNDMIANVQESVLKAA